MQNCFSLEGEKSSVRAHSITTWKYKRGGRGSKMFVFVHPQGIKTVHAEGGDQNGKILSTYLLNAP
jgi:hypothetical protein